MTELLFLDDAYARQASATVLGTEGRRILLDRSVFFPQGGGQPGDAGTLSWPAGALAIETTLYASDRSGVTLVAAGNDPLPSPGQTVETRVDWQKRLARMRIHTALHLLTAVLPYPVTGGAVGDGDGRLDFDIPDAGLDPAEIETRLQRLVDTDAEVTTRWITGAELAANPGLVKTMSVKPPTGSGRVRLVAIGDIDLQPCGGTHVARTGEIGKVAVVGIEKKGRQNRRVRIALG